MNSDMAMASRFVLPLPSFVLHPLTAVVVAAVHVYLAFGHLSELLGGEIQWTHIWKGFGALAGAYIFAALASRAFARNGDLYFYGKAPPQSAQARLDGITQCISLKSHT
jgi:hypothetical protein